MCECCEMRKVPIRKIFITEYAILLQNLLLHFPHPSGVELCHPMCEWMNDIWAFAMLRNMSLLFRLYGEKSSSSHRVSSVSSNGDKSIVSNGRIFLLHVITPRDYLGSYCLKHKSHVFATQALSPVNTSCQVFHIFHPSKSTSNQWEWWWFYSTFICLSSLWFSFCRLPFLNSAFCSLKFYYCIVRYSFFKCDHNFSSRRRMKTIPKTATAIKCHR